MGNNQSLNPWTELDERILKSTYKFQCNDKIIMRALFPIRSKVAILHKAQRLGLTKLEGPKWSKRTKLSWTKENNPHWNFNPNKNTGHCRARKWFNCPTGKEIHHIDGNPLNNSPDNIEFLTRTEHVRKDGRISHREKNGRLLNKKLWRY
jgi:hypothetical protein